MQIHRSNNNISVSPFAHKVYEALKTIPDGRVITYAELGKLCRCNSPRAIGGALRKNPFAPEVPCHRVIKSNLNIGGFSGRLCGEAIKKKLRLLKKEGVAFNKSNNLIDKDRLITAKAIKD